MPLVVGHGRREIFRDGLPFAHFTALGGKRHQGLDAGRHDAHGNRCVTGRLLDAEDIALPEARRLASFARSAQALGEGVLGKTQREAVLVRQLRACLVVFATDAGHLLGRFLFARASCEQQREEQEEGRPDPGGTRHGALLASTREGAPSMR